MFSVKKKKASDEIYSIYCVSKKLIEREWFTFKGEMNTQSNWNSSDPSKKYAIGQVHLVDHLNFKCVLSLSYLQFLLVRFG
jgi:hypothetical protein